MASGETEALLELCERLSLEPSPVTHIQWFRASGRELTIFKLPTKEVVTN